MPNDHPHYGRVPFMAHLSPLFSDFRHEEHNIAVHLGARTKKEQLADLRKSYVAFLTANLRLLEGEPKARAARTITNLATVISSGTEPKPGRAAPLPTSGLYRKPSPDAGRVDADQTDLVSEFSDRNPLWGTAPLAWFRFDATAQLWRAQS